MAPKSYIPKFSELEVVFSMGSVLRNFLDGELSGIGLSTNRMLALMFVAQRSDAGIHCIGEGLTQHLGLAKTTGQNLVASMKKEGLLQEIVIPGWHDGRRKQLRLTPKGQRRLDRGWEVWTSSISQAIAGIDADALRAFFEAAKPLYGAAERIQRTIALPDDVKYWGLLGRA